MSDDNHGMAGDRTRNGALIGAFGVLLLVDFVIVLVMLGTDKNLQTDFGAVSPYYAHWYGLLAEGIVDLIVALGLLSLLAVPMMRDRSPRSRRRLVMLAVIWPIIAILAMVGIVTSWQQVGFRSMSQFSQYLFQTTPYPGALSYIPWLYDLLLAAYVVTALVGVLALLRMRALPPASSAP
jgi:hypothetical protein